MGPLQFRVPEIRPASLADAALLDELLPRCVRLVLPGFTGPLRTPLPLGHLASLDRMLVADGTGLIVQMGDVPLAFGAWSRRDRDPATAGPDGGARPLDPETEPARVLSLAVRADFMGLGVAAGILEEFAASARGEGFRRLALMAVPDAVTMCSRVGFETIERRSIEVDGVATDAVEMVLRVRS